MECDYSTCSTLIPPHPGILTIHNLSFEMTFESDTKYSVIQLNEHCVNITNDYLPVPTYTLVQSFLVVLSPNLYFKRAFQLEFSLLLGNLIDVL